jgi:transcriptional regulator with PAS, ATPase and Fis domain
VSGSRARLTGRTTVGGLEDGELPTMVQMEKRLIQAALQRHPNNHAEVARKLGISRSTLWRKLKEYGLPG